MVDSLLPPVETGPAIAWAAARLRRAALSYGHGTDNPQDEAAALVFYAAGWAHADAPAAYQWLLSDAVRAHIAVLVKRRIKERIPSAYLTGVTWFAGHEMRVDPRVLVPRSPIAELIETEFRPFIDPSRVHRILDMGTGSGCIAIACAHAFPQALVDAVDISPAALEVAAANVVAHGLEARVSLQRSDVFSGVMGRQYDMIVSNPPYVPIADVEALPPEYAHEPALGLASGADGLNAVRAILADWRQYLTPGGILVVEVGDSAAAVEHTWPQLPFIWLEFERGGGGVFLLTME
jgi:ribosomal protein L3 glutamine methyltransferase